MNRLNRAQRRALLSKKTTSQTRVNPRTQPLFHKKTKLENNTPTYQDIADNVNGMSDIEVAKLERLLEEKKIRDEKKRKK